MMGGLSPETCWTSYNYGLVKVDTLWHLVGFVMNCTMMHGPDISWRLLITKLNQTAKTIEKMPEDILLHLCKGSMTCQWADLYETHASSTRLDINCCIRFQENPIRVVVADTRSQARDWQKDFFATRGVFFFTSQKKPEVTQRTIYRTKLK
jgi:hypothetical protein